MMKLFKAVIIAFATYSRIPMPHIDMDEKDMLFVPSAFPLIGVIIGLLEYGWIGACNYYEINIILRCCIMAAIPLIVTGGFHLDGFMDCADGFNSYKPAADKLKILSDPHIGAFAVIRTIILMLIVLGAVSCINDYSMICMFAASFTVSRIFSSYGLLLLKSAKPNGSLYYVSSNASKRSNLIILSIELIMTVAFLIWTCGLTGLILPGIAIVYLLVYRFQVYRLLGGITGDTAGYFLTVFECLAAVTIGIINLWL